MNRAGNRILVIRGGAIGDFILTLPVLSALRTHFPQSQLHLVAYPRVAELARAAGLADEVRSIEARALSTFFAPHASLDEELCRYFESFAAVVSYLYDFNEVFQKNFKRCSRAQFIQGPHRPDETQAIHATEVFLKPLERLAIFASDPTPKLTLQNGSSKIESAPRLALHPGSGSEKKNWPEINWAALLTKLLEVGHLNLLLIGGEAEGGRIDRLRSLAPADRCQVARNLPLPDLARAMISCCGFIGHDSGITHLAGALGLPGLALWGDSNEKIWRPRSDKIKIIRDDRGLARLAVERVTEEIAQLVSHVRVGG
jgi:ADP-heptose:LPS heptosyltransferase